MSRPTLSTQLLKRSSNVLDTDSKSLSSQLHTNLTVGVRQTKIAALNAGLGISFRPSVDNGHLVLRSTAVEEENEKNELREEGRNEELGQKDNKSLHGEGKTSVAETLHAIAKKSKEAAIGKGDKVWKEQNGTKGEKQGKVMSVNQPVIDFGLKNKVSIVGEGLNDFLKEWCAIQCMVFLK